MSKKIIKVTKNKYPIVRVVWRDSNIYQRQDTIEFASTDYKIETVTSVGFLLGYQNKNPMITRDLMNNNIDQRGTIVIPIENIVSLVKVEVSDIN